MKIYISILICLVAFASLAFAQVDTMRLLEVGSVTAPGAITNWYFEDLNGDSIKEIILTTANSVNIYSGQSFAPIWSQDGFTGPKDLNFADINNDGLIDFSVKDTSHIYLIDPHHSTTIWTSPMLDSTYKCYTIGDRNLDSVVDIVMIKAEVFNRVGIENNQDTIWIECYDSPLYNLTADTFMLCFYYSYYYNNTVHYTRSELPEHTSIYSLTFESQAHNYLFLFNTIYLSSSQSTMTTSANNGAAYIFDLQLLELKYSVGLGKMLQDYQFVTGDSAYVGILREKSSYASGGGFVSYYKTYSIGSIGSDTFNIDTIWTAYRSYQGGGPEPHWNSYTIAFRTPETAQIIFSSGDSIYVNSFPQNGYIWAISTGHKPQLLNSFTSYPVAESSLIMYYLGLFNSTYKFVYADNGDLRYVLPNTGFSNLRSVTLHLGHADYIYSVRLDSLYFYTLAPYIGINNQSLTPSSFFLSPNYPNPFNASTLIEYGLPESGPVEVEIFDILGRKIQTLVDETQAAGYHQVVWNGEHSPSGTYFYRIQAGEKSQTRKCLLLK